MSFLLVLLALLALAAARPLVKLDCGAEVEGSKVEAFEVHAFEGLRYAAPPIGQLRWASPQDLSCGGTGSGSPCAQMASAGFNLPFSIANAFILPLAIYLLPALAGIFCVCAACFARRDNAATGYIEMSRVEEARPAEKQWRAGACGILALLPLVLMPALPGWVWSGMIGDEDCLYLNVYTPATTAEPRAVLVWVHGGGYLAGSGRLDDATYGSSLEIPAAGDVVHVTLNYRLGAFGFLYLNDNETVANLGLQDVLAALRWVRRNIHSFGGDPDRVLLYGHSAGATSVAALQRMPAASGLFRAAAALSPVWSLGAAPARAAAAWRAALRPIGCSDLPCLRGKPARVLAGVDLGLAGSTWGKVTNLTEPDMGVPLLVADGELTADWVVDVPVLVTGCREEGDYNAAANDQTGAEAWPFTRRSFDAWAERTGVPAEKLWPLYAGSPRQKWDQLGTDITLFCARRALVERAKVADRRTSPAYLSIWTYAVPFNFAMMDVKYTAEGIDLWLIWGKTAIETTLNFHPSAEALAVGRTFRGFLLQMARSGSLGSQWRPYPAVCEYGGNLTCSEHDNHSQACSILDATFGQKFYARLR